MSAQTGHPAGHPAGISRKTLVWTGVLVFALKFLTVYYLSGLVFCQNPETAGSRLASLTGDSFSYIGAMENYISTGRYFFLNFKGEEIVAGRTPHYALPYFLLRQVADRSTALNLFVVYQITVETIAILCAALLAVTLVRRSAAFTLTIFAFGASLYLTAYDYTNFTDGVATNLLLISAFAFRRYLDNGRKGTLWVASAVLALATCMRPYFAVFFVLAGCYELYRHFRQPRRLVQTAAILSLPLLVLLAPWVARNYRIFHRVIPFQQDAYAGYGYGQNNLGLRKLLILLGEDATTTWDPKTAASYFAGVPASTYHYPAHVNRRPDLRQALDSIRTRGLRHGESVNLQPAMDSFRSAYRSAFPFRARLLNPLKRVGVFVVNSGSYYLPINKDFRCYRPYQWVIKLSQSAMYYLALLPGTLGLLLAARRERRNLVLIAPLAALIVVFPLILGFVEWRYFVPFYPFGIIGLVFLLMLFRRRQSPDSFSGGEPNLN